MNQGFTFFYINIWLSQHQSKDYFSTHHLLQRIILASLLKINWPCIWASISGFSILSHWFICLSIYQYHTVLIIAALWWSSEIRQCELSNFVLFQKSFTILYIGFSLNFRTSLSNSTKSLLQFWLELCHIYKSVWKNCCIKNTESSNPLT